MATLSHTYLLTFKPTTFITLVTLKWLQIVDSYREITGSELVCSLIYFIYFTLDLKLFLFWGNKKNICFVVKNVLFQWNNLPIVVDIK